MTPDQLQRLERLEVMIGTLIKADSAYLRLNKSVALRDSAHILLGTGTGTKIGTATTQKLGFFNATPVTQRTAVAHPAGGGLDSDGTARDAIDAILTRLEALGLFAA